HGGTPGGGWESTATPGRPPGEPAASAAGWRMVVIVKPRAGRCQHRVAGEGGARSFRSRQASIHPGKPGGGRRAGGGAPVAARQRPTRASRVGGPCWRAGAGPRDRSGPLSQKIGGSEDGFCVSYQVGKSRGQEAR